MARRRHVKEGPNRKEYGLNPQANSEIDTTKRIYSNNQKQDTKRSKLASQVSREGGRVSWGDQKEREEIVLPMSKAQEEKLYERAKHVAEELKTLRDKYRVDIPDGLTSGHEIMNRIRGESDSSISYTATGQVYLAPDGGGRAYTLSEANSVLRNLERYAVEVEKRKSFGNRHGNKSKIEAKATGTMVILGLIGGLFFLLPNLTGNVVSNTNNSTKIIGAISIIIAIIGAFFYFRKK